MVATARLRHFAGFRVIRTNIRHPSLAFLSLGSANSAGTSSCVTLDSGVECAKHDGDALLRECFSWRESRYVRDMTIHRSPSRILFGRRLEEHD
jgi:hypothetical protein